MERKSEGLLVSVVKTIVKMSSPKLQICPQCGNDWGANPKQEFCARCGSAAFGTRVSHDPLRPISTVGLIAIDRRTKKVIRWGIFGLGVICIITGFCLFYGGWISFQSQGEVPGQPPDSI